MTWGYSLLGKDSFQKIDIAGITTPITKYSFIVKDVNQIYDSIRRLFPSDGKGRRVLVVFTKDVTANKNRSYIKKEAEICKRSDILRHSMRMI